MTESRKLRIGIIGAGPFAERHMDAFAEIPEVEVVAFMRRSTDALKEMQDRWDVPRGYTDHRLMLADPDVDAIDIVSPTSSHKRYALDAIATGRPVLCEKPLALTASDCREMLDAAEKAGVVHATNFNQRGRTSAGRMKRYLEEGYVGDTYHTNIFWGMTLQSDVRPDALAWRFAEGEGGGTVYELIHVFDMARFLNGEVARIVSLLNTAEKSRSVGDMEDHLEVVVPDSSAFMMEHVNGSYTIAHTSFVSRGTGTSQGVRVDVSGSRGRIMTDGVYGLLGNSGDHGPLEQLDPGEAHAQPYERFVKAALSGDQSLIDTGFDAGFQAARLVDAAMESYALGRWVDLN